jgi:hypothetical protein
MTIIRLILFLGLVSLLTACGGAPTSPITPSVDRLTFLFLYTEN